MVSFPCRCWSAKQATVVCGYGWQSVGDGEGRASPWWVCGLIVLCLDGWMIGDGWRGLRCGNGLPVLLDGDGRVMGNGGGSRRVMVANVLLGVGGIAGRGGRRWVGFGGGRPAMASAGGCFLMVSLSNSKKDRMWMMKMAVCGFGGKGWV
ncbi:hypothetical protein Dimus_003783 [Dionaea muscipula]